MGDRDREVWMVRCFFVWVLLVMFFCVGCAGGEMGRMVRPRVAQIQVVDAAGWESTKVEGLGDVVGEGEGVARPLALLVPTAVAADVGHGVEENGVAEPIKPVAGWARPLFEWGAQTHHFDNHERMKEMGMGWVKIQYKWRPESEPRDVLDRIVQARARGFKILLAIPGEAYPDEIDYEAYVRFLAGVALLRPAPDGIEVWNEMNIDFEWPVGEIDPAVYVTEMLAPAYQVIKRNNPDILVISGAPAPTGFDNGVNAWADERYLAGMVAAGAADYADCVGVHYNAGGTSPHAVTGHLAGGHYGWYFRPSLERSFNLFGGRLPLCVTEIGYLTAGDLSGKALPRSFWWAAETSVEEHALWLAEAASLARGSGIVRLFVVFNADIWHWDGRDPQMGYALFRPQGNCPACERLAEVDLSPTAVPVAGWLNVVRPRVAQVAQATPVVAVDYGDHGWLPDAESRLVLDQLVSEVPLEGDEGRVVYRDRLSAQRLAAVVSGPVDGAAVLADPQVEFFKIGFHVGPDGDERGLGEWMRRLDEARVPFFLKSVDSAGQLYEAQQLVLASGVPHVLVYRRSQGAFELPDYGLDPVTAAREHWARHVGAFPPELDPSLVWMETINEVDRSRAAWLGLFAAETARLAIRDQRKWAAFGWSSGEPEMVDWTSAGMVEFLRLAADYPELLAVALHEYSYVTDSLEREYPFLVGRFQQLFAVCDQLGIGRPTVLVTEFGWSYREVARPEVALAQLARVAQLYGSYPEVKGAAIWYLGSGFGEVDQGTRLLLEPVTGVALQTVYDLRGMAGKRQ